MKVWLVVVALYFPVNGQVDGRNANKQFLVSDWNQEGVSQSQFNEDIIQSQKTSLPENDGANPALSKARSELHEVNPLYSYLYGVDDPISGELKNHKENQQGSQVKGAYSVFEPDGTLRTVEYTADPITGFKAYIKQSRVPMNKYQYAPDQNKYHHEEFKPRYVYKQLSIYPNSYANHQGNNPAQNSDLPISSHVYYAISYKTPQETMPNQLCNDNNVRTSTCRDSPISPPTSSDHYLTEPVTASSLDDSHLTNLNNGELGLSLAPSSTIPHDRLLSGYSNQNNLHLKDQYLLERVYPARKIQHHESTTPSSDAKLNHLNRLSTSNRQYDQLTNYHETSSKSRQTDVVPTPKSQQQQGSFYYFTMTKLPINYHQPAH